jgi:alpha-ketoglutarate-dependent taurine dioxygenase
LYAEHVSDLGGDTLWSNMYAAYDALSEQLKLLVSNLSTYEQPVTGSMHRLSTRLAALERRTVRP